MTRCRIPGSSHRSASITYSAAPVRRLISDAGVSRRNAPSSSRKTWSPCFSPYFSTHGFGSEIVSVDVPTFWTFLLSIRFRSRPVLTISHRRGSIYAARPGLQSFTVAPPLPEVDDGDRRAEVQGRGPE